MVKGACRGRDNRAWFVAVFVMSVAVLLATVGTGFVAAMAIEGHAAAARSITGVVSLCPAAPARQ